MLEPSSSEEDNPDVQDEEEIEQKPSSGIPGTTNVDSISQSGHAQQFDRCFIQNRGRYELKFFVIYDKVIGLNII